MLQGVFLVFASSWLGFSFSSRLVIYGVHESSIFAEKKKEKSRQTINFTFTQTASMVDVFLFLFAASFEKSYYPDLLRFRFLFYTFVVVCSTSIWQTASILQNLKTVASHPLVVLSAKYPLDI